MVLFGFLGETEGFGRVISLTYCLRFGIRPQLLSILCSLSLQKYQALPAPARRQVFLLCFASLHISINLVYRLAPFESLRLSQNIKEKRCRGSFFVLLSRRDSNPRALLHAGTLAVCWFQPLTHNSC